MTHYIGDFTADSTIRIPLTTHRQSGGSVAPLSAFEAADFKIYKDGSTTEKTTTNGLTIASPFDSVVGLHALIIDTTNNTGDTDFWEAGHDYWVVLSPDETVDGETVVAVVATFSIDNRAAVNLLTPLSLTLLTHEGMVENGQTARAILVRTGGDTELADESSDIGSSDDNYLGWTLGSFAVITGGRIRGENDRNITHSRTITTTGDASCLLDIEVSSNADNLTASVHVDGVEEYSQFVDTSLSRRTVTVPVSGAGAHTLEVKFLNGGSDANGFNYVSDVVLTVPTSTDLSTDEIQITLVSSDNSVATVPGTLTLSGGEKSAFFDITTNSVGHTTVKAHITTDKRTYEAFLPIYVRTPVSAESTSLAVLVQSTIAATSSQT